MTRNAPIVRLGYLLGFFWLGCICQAQTLADDLAAVADIVVDLHGSGDYLTVQAGLDAVPDSSDQWTVVLVKRGIYQEKVVLNHKKTKVVLVGEDVDSTIITNDDYGDLMLPGGHTFSTYTFRADPHDFQAYNITFENPSRQGQAVAFHSNGDRQILHHCKLLGYQDTYFDNFRTRRYVNDCYIRGDVDFIFGFGVTLFDSCQIHCVDDGYITASATPQHYEFGHVFTHCWITSPGHWSPDIYLGRPWFPYANTAFLYTWQTEDVFSIGWGRWDGRENTCLYYEYDNYGPGFRPDRRVPFGQFLDSTQAQRYQPDTIFAAATFPSDLGPAVDSIELWSVRQRFEDAGYVERADTILYAGRDVWPSYPTDDWSPTYYAPVHDLIEAYTTPFGASVDTSTATHLLDPATSPAELVIVNPVGETLRLRSYRTFPAGATLSLFDVNGRLIAQRQLGALTPGLHELRAEGLTLQPGVYLYQLQADDYVSCGKLLKQGQFLR